MRFESVAANVASNRSVLLGAILTTLAHLSRISMGFIFLKLMAIYLGVDGLGQLGNFMSAVMFLSLLAGGGVQNGVIKYVAEYRREPKRLRDFLLATKTYSSSICALSLVAVLFAAPLADSLLGDSSFYWIICLMIMAQFGFAFTNIVNGVANGLHQTRVFASIQIAGNLITIPVAWVLIAWFDFAGAALAVIMLYFSYVIPAFYFYLKSNFRRHMRGWLGNIKNFRKLGDFTLMTLVGAISVPLVEIMVRSVLIDEVGLSAAGLWQASIKLSSSYMGFFVVFLAAYFMPLVSVSEQRSDVARVVRKFMLLIMGLFAVGGLLFFLFRRPLISLLLSKEFDPLAEFIGYQLLGDFLRISTYVIGFVIIAKAATRLYLVIEISQGIVFYLLSIVLLHAGFGLKSIFIAHMTMNAIYFTSTVLGFYFYIKKDIKC